MYRLYVISRSRFSMIVLMFKALQHADSLQMIDCPTLAKRNELPEVKHGIPMYVVWFGQACEPCTLAATIRKH